MSRRFENKVVFITGPHPVLARRPPGNWLRKARVWRYWRVGKTNLPP